MLPHCGTARALGTCDGNCCLESVTSGLEPRLLAVGGEPLLLLQEWHHHAHVDASTRV